MYRYTGSNDIYTTYNILVSRTGFTRVVEGGRGAYVEFSKDQIITTGLHIPKDALWKTNRIEDIYYFEYRTSDNVKVYDQIRTVKYADYKVGMLYISVFNLKHFERVK